MSKPWLAEHCPTVAALLVDADHVDVKQIESRVPLRPFVASMLSFDPPWLRALYGIRGLFVRLLGMRQPGIPQGVRIEPEALPMVAGEKAHFFTVTAAEEGRFWVAHATDRHLTAWIAVVAEPAEGRTRFHVATIVRYHHWTGPLYFNVIRPFHHLVVWAMMRAGTRPTPHAAHA